MSRDELTGLSQGALIELILRLQERIAALEERVRRPPKTPANASIPPGQARAANRPVPPVEGPRPGAQPGHTGTTRPFAEPTERIALRIAAPVHAAARICAWSSRRRLSVAR